MKEGEGLVREEKVPFARGLFTRGWSASYADSSLWMVTWWYT